MVFQRPLKKAAILALFALSAAPAWALGALDGKTFEGVVGESSQPDRVRPDKFVFASGKFKSSVFSGLGYGAGNYTASNDGAAVRFEARSLHKNGGSAKWDGMVFRGDIEGSVTVLERGEPERRSWFKGRLM